MLTFMISLVIDIVGVRFMVAGVVVIGVVIVLFLVTALALYVGCPRLA